MISESSHGDNLMHLKKKKKNCFRKVRERPCSLASSRVNLTISLWPLICKMRIMLII